MSFFNVLTGYYRTAYNDGDEREPKTRAKVEIDPSTGKKAYRDRKANAFLPIDPEARRKALRAIIAGRYGKNGRFRRTFYYISTSDGKNLLVGSRKA
jgi:hypothetical protein